MQSLSSRESQPSPSHPAFQGPALLRLIDFEQGDEQNVRVPTELIAWRLVATALLLLGSFFIQPAEAADSGGATTLYWCPGRSTGELQVKPLSGCQPLVQEKKDDPKDAKDAGIKPAKPRELPSVKPEQLETEITKYLEDYNDFLSCCATNLSAEQLEQIESLEDRASGLIKQTANAISVASLYLSRTQALIVPVARARDQLRALKSKHEHVTKSKTTLEDLDHEQAGRERRRIQDMEESIGRDFTATREPSRAATGADIGRSGATGPSVGASAPTGPGIGSKAATGTAIGIQPPTLGELVDTPPDMERNRDNSLTTTKPVTGGRVGQDAGDSSFNNNARTGPALGESSFNR
jgi:hypothetical protein